LRPDLLLILLLIDLMWYSCWGRKASLLTQQIFSIHHIVFHFKHGRLVCVHLIRNVIITGYNYLIFFLLLWGFIKVSLRYLGVWRWLFIWSLWIKTLMWCLEYHSSLCHLGIFVHFPLHSKLTCCSISILAFGFLWKVIFCCLMNKFNVQVLLGRFFVKIYLFCLWTNFPLNKTWWLRFNIMLLDWWSCIAQELHFGWFLARFASLYIRVWIVNIWKISYLPTSLFRWVCKIRSCNLSHKFVKRILRSTTRECTLHCLLHKIHVWAFHCFYLLLTFWQLLRDTCSNKTSEFWWTTTFLHDEFISHLFLYF